LIPAADKLAAEKLNVIAVAVVAVKFRFAAPAVGHKSRAGLPLVVISIPEVDVEV